jgi:uncharacterized protein (DUF934 family)
MKILKSGSMIENDWQLLADEVPLPEMPVQRILVGLERWRRDRERFLVLGAAGVALGVRLRSDQPAEALAEDAGRLALVVIEFPSFRDGRGFSTGRLLRERHGFTGELRAEGPLLPDQFRFLHRCGFNALALPDTARLAHWEKYLSQISFDYQPSVDRNLTIVDRRHGVADTAAGSVS